MTNHEVCVQLRNGYVGLGVEIDKALDNLSENNQVVRELIALRTAGASDMEASYIDELLDRCVEIRKKNLEVLESMSKLRDEYKKVLDLHKDNEW